MAELPAPLQLASAPVEATEPATTKLGMTRSRSRASGTGQFREGYSQANEAISAALRAVCDRLPVHGSSTAQTVQSHQRVRRARDRTKFIYVFDRPTSMEGRPLAAAAVLESLQSLESVNQFNIRVNTKTQAFDITSGGHRIAFASDRSQKLALNFVGGITAGGGTDRMFALRTRQLNYAPGELLLDRRG